MDKRKLYETIMRSVAREVKKALDENLEVLMRDTDFCKLKGRSIKC